MTAKISYYDFYRYILLPVFILCLFSLIKIIFLYNLNQCDSAPVPDTGQTTCYNNDKKIDCPEKDEKFYGQDANYKINPISFQKLDIQGNELPYSATDWSMVKDNITGLIWEVKTNDGSIHDKDNKYTWYDTNPETNNGIEGYTNNNINTESFINELNISEYGGYSDWRMPTIKELQLINDFDTNENDIAVNKLYFSNNIVDFYWSSTSNAEYPDYAWGVYFSNANDSSKKKSSCNYVRAVRGKKFQFVDNMVINNDNTITDLSTGLMWQKYETNSKKNWKSAISYCENLTQSNYFDWRLPDQKELKSIVNYSKYNPAMIKIYFPNIISDIYWSSTSYAKYNNQAWGLNFYNGDGNSEFKSSTCYLRAVRGGQAQSANNLTILSPRQASKWLIDSTLPVIWKTANLDENVQISISYHGGKQGTFQTIHENTENDGFFEWNIPKPASVNCIIKITPINSKDKESIEGLFYIVDTDPPTFSQINKQTINFGQQSHSMKFSISDSDEGPLYVWAKSSNQELVPDSNINLGSDLPCFYTVTTAEGGTKEISMTITPLKNKAGTTTITLAVNDAGYLKDITSFEFQVFAYTINASSGPNGCISPSGEIFCTPDKNQDFVITPDEFYKIDSIIVDGKLISSINSYQFLKISDNHTISVSFKYNPFYISYIPGQVAYDKEPLIVEFSIIRAYDYVKPLSLSVNSLNTNLVPNDNKHLYLSGIGNYRKLKITPIGQIPDISIITLYASDSNGLSKTRKFQFTALKIPDNLKTPVSDTGQEKCYSNSDIIQCPKNSEEFYGQDANYNINPISFTKFDSNGNAVPLTTTEWCMVRDNVTGLIWEVKTDGDSDSIHDNEKTFSWDSSTKNFIQTLNDSEFGSYSDWRMPTFNELVSIVDYNSHNPAINGLFFPNAISGNYWSSTTYADDTGWAWCVDFDFYGCRDIYSKSSDKYVRAVRSRQYGSFKNLIINKDKTVTDINTGLMWQQVEVEANISAKNWESALSYCENLTQSNYFDWRLPDLKELKSIVNYSKHNPAVLKIFFSNIMLDFYWSSTTSARDPDSALGASFSDGWFYKSKSSAYYVFAVRGGQSRKIGNLLILSPRQASMWRIYDKLPIIWDTADINENVHISISYYGGKQDTFLTIHENTVNDGYFEWTIPDNISPNCMIKIAPINNKKKGTTEGLFCISDDKPPTISQIKKQIINIGQQTHTIRFSISDTDNEPLNVWAKSSNQDLVPDENINLGGDLPCLYTVVTAEGGTMEISMTITPLKNTAGMTTITLTAIDSGYLTNFASFDFHVFSPPEISTIPVQITYENEPLVINFSIFSHNVSANSLIFSLTSSNNDLVPNDNKHLYFSGTNNDRMLTIIPVGKAPDISFISLNVADSNGLSRTRQFQLTVLKFPDNLNEPLPDTGQTYCYNSYSQILCPECDEDYYGQDANYNINPISFTKIDSNGIALPLNATEWCMVRDNVTGLIWEVKNDNIHSINYNDSKYKWEDTINFINYLNNKKFGGYSDWRMPTFNELVSIVDYNSYNPAINGLFFPNAKSGVYLSSNTYAYNTNRAWAIDFDYGDSSFGYYNNELYSYYVRAVRSAQSLSFENLFINKDETVTDINTGLMWQQVDASTSRMNWESAISYCEDLTQSNYFDWRLPDQKELQSIVNYSKYNPSISTQFFPNNMSDDYYWSSTTNASNRSYAWGVSLFSGNLFSGNLSRNGTKSSCKYVQAVRGGQSRIFGNLIILSPRQASLWRIGNNLSIIWDTAGIKENVKISISYYGGKNGTFQTIHENTENDGYFEWTIPEKVSSNCMMKITPITNINKGTTEGLFCIVDDNPPTITQINDQIINIGQQTHSIKFSLSDTDNGTLNVWAKSSNQDLVPDENINLGADLPCFYTVTTVEGGTKDISMTITPLKNKAGMATITLTVIDSGYLTNSTSFDFSVFAHTITALTGPNGSISPSGEIFINSAENQKFIIAPDEKYEINTIIVDGKFIPITNTYTFTNISDNHTISITFKLFPDIDISYISGQYTYENEPIVIDFSINSTLVSENSLILSVKSSNINLVPNDNKYLYLSETEKDRKIHITPIGEPPDISFITLNVSDSDGLSKTREFQFTSLKFPYNLKSPVPDTGQINCFSNSKSITCPESSGESFYGQDANYEINPISLTKLDINGNPAPLTATEWYMVRDNVTGLIWEVKSDDSDSIHYRDKKFTWYSSDFETNGYVPGDFNNYDNTESFIAELNCSEFGGYSDWRMPTIHELLSIVVYNSFKPAINEMYFPNNNLDLYWSSNSNVGNPKYAWGINFNEGNNYRDKTLAKYARAVRGVQSMSFENLIINKDKTVTDINTGLMWQRVEGNISEINWESAISYCENLTQSNYFDWRLPDQKELISIVNYSKYNPTISNYFFPKIMSKFYWSSTTPSYRNVWGVDFDMGSDKYAQKSSSYYVKAVRGSQSRKIGNLIILSPRQATKWQIGDTMQIIWDTENINENVQISISYQGGKTGTFEIIHDNTENDGFFEWIIPKPASVNCMLKITPIKNSNKGTSEGLFCIVDENPPAITQIKTQQINLGQYFHSIKFSISDTDDGPLIVWAKSSNQNFVPDANINLGGDLPCFYTVTTAEGGPKEISMTIKPIENKIDKTTITLTVNDAGYLKSITSFDFNVQWKIIALSGDNGSITPSGENFFYTGCNQQFVIAPDINYEINTINVDGNFIAATNSYIFTNISDNHEISVTFKKNILFTPYDISEIPAQFTYENEPLVVYFSSKNSNVSVNSSNTNLIPNNNRNLYISGTDHNSKIIITPTGDQPDISIISLNYYDSNGLPEETKFQFTVLKLPENLGNPVSDTWLTKCYDNKKIIQCPEPGEDFYGQDVNYKINPLSFTKLDANSNALPLSSAEWCMVRDNVTGLIWEVKTDDESIHNKYIKLAWTCGDSVINDNELEHIDSDGDTDSFINILNSSEFGGYTDWRIPTLNELLSILAYDTNNAANVDIFFPNSISNFYWSSIAKADNSDYAWGLNFQNGFDKDKSKSDKNYVRAVRGKIFKTNEHLFINNDKTVTDINTGLMWQRHDNNTEKSWESAISYSENLTFSGYSDWRLPNQNELKSLINYSNYGPSLTKYYFSDIMSDLYWSSTTNSNNPELALGVNFYDGNNFSSNKLSRHFVRTVRGGQAAHSFNNLFILSPRQSTKWKIGDTLKIMWETANINENVQISISYQAGKKGTFEIIQDNTENDGLFDWIIPEPASVNCMIKITPVNSNDKGGSEGLFSIVDENPPIISEIRKQIINMSQESHSVKFSISDTDDGYLNVWAESSNKDLVPDDNIDLGGDSPNFYTVTSAMGCEKEITMTIKPALNITGTTTITLTVNDSGFLKSVESFDFTVLPYSSRINTIIAVSSIGGQISPTGLIYAENEKNILFSFTPDYGYEVDYIKLDEQIIHPQNNQYLLNNIIDDHKISVYFKFFKDNIMPDAPEIISPVENEIINESYVTLISGTYNDPDYDPHRCSYWMIRAINTPFQCSNFNSFFCYKSSIGKLTTYTLSELKTGMKYAWKVGYSDFCNDNPIFSNETTFIIGNSLLDESVNITPGSNVNNFKMVSFVQWPDNPSSMAVLGNAIDYNYDTNSYRIGTYDPNINNGEYIECDQDFNIVPGKSYWILARNGMNCKINGVFVSLTEPIDVKLKYNLNNLNGWNMIACPNAKNYSWNKIQVILYDSSGNMINEYGQIVLNHEIKTIAQLDHENLFIEKNLWTWNNGQYILLNPYETSKAIMYIYEGYWVKARRNNIYLRFSPDAALPVDSTISNNSQNSSLIDYHEYERPPNPMSGFADNSVSLKDGNESNCFINYLTYNFVKIILTYSIYFIFFIIIILLCIKFLFFCIKLNL